jgi:hypothetical protein
LIWLELPEIQIKNTNLAFCWTCAACSADNTTMIQLREIKHTEYMRGTKAFRLRMYIFVGMIGFTAVACVPIHFLLKRKYRPRLQDKMEKEDADVQKLQEVYKVNEMLFEKKK